jgi:hypothetical protein
MKRKPPFQASPDFFDYTPDEDPCPEKQLIAALLDRTIRDLIEPANDILDLHRQEAIEFTYSPDTKPYTFIWCCEELDIDPKKIITKAEQHGIIYPRRWRVDIGRDYWSLIDSNSDLSGLVPAWIPKRKA